MPLVKNKVRAVRIAAADVFTGIPIEQIPQEYQDAYSIAQMVRIHLRWLSIPSFIHLHFEEEIILLISS